MAVIPGPRHKGSLPEVIQTTVANVRPPSRTLLHDTYGARRARPLLDRQVCPELHDLLMGTTQCQVQEAHGVEERLRGMPEGLEDDLLRYLGGPRSVRVASH